MLSKPVPGWLAPFLAVLVWAAPARADGDRFEDESHRAWYRRFLHEGGTVLLRRVPSWEETVGRIVRGLPDGERAALRRDLMDLGCTVGFEWAKANGRRRVGNKELSRWGGMLEAAGRRGDVVHIRTALDGIRREVAARIGPSAGGTATATGLAPCAPASAQTGGHRPCASTPSRARVVSSPAPPRGAGGAGSGEEGAERPDGSSARFPRAAPSRGRPKVASAR